MGKSELEGAFFGKKAKPAPARQLTPRSVRPGSVEELTAWEAAARAQGVSLHTLMLYAVRRLIADIEAGFEIPTEPTGAKRVKMP